MRRGQLRDERQHLVDRRRRVVPHRHVERLGGDVLFRAIRDRAFDASGDGSTMEGWKRPASAALRQLVGERARLLGHDVESKDFDGDEPIARGLVGSKNGSKGADTDLMQHPEGAKRRRGRKSGRVVSGQLRCSSTAAKPRIEHSHARDLSHGQHGNAYRHLARFACTRNPHCEMRRVVAVAVDRWNARSCDRCVAVVGRLDMICRALREYEAVTAETTFADGSTRTAIDVRRFGWIRPLAGDYAFDFAKIAPLYAGDPSTRQAWTEAIARTRAMARPHAAVAALLAAQQERRGAPPAAREAARKLADPRRSPILTGQQAGAFGGPLFTLLKAVTAIQLARGRRARTAGRRRPGVLGRRRRPRLGRSRRAVRCSTRASSRTPSRCPSPRAPASDRSPRSCWTAGVEHSLDELANALGETEFSEVAHGLASRRYRPGVGMADAFARWLETLLGPHGLVVYDSSDPAAKPLVADLFARELGAAGRTAALAKAAGDALTPAGISHRSLPSPTASRSFI